MPTQTQSRTIIFFVLRKIAYAFKILPAPIFSLLWRASDVFEGKFGSALRYTLISQRLKKCGQSVYFGPFIVIDNPANLMIGNDVSIHHNTTLLTGGGIVIGDSVSIAHGCSLVSGNHTWAADDTPIKRNPVQLARIEIASDCWIGCGVRILSGTHIERRVVVAAGAVVTKSISCRQVVGGVPAKTIKLL